MNKVNNFLYEKLSYELRGCFYHVYNTLGFGHKEVIYQRALEQTLLAKSINFQREKSLPIFFEEKQVGSYKPDFIVDDKIIVELKALEFLPQQAEQQLFHYLKGTGYSLGFLVNFGSSQLIIKRKIWFKDSKNISEKSV